jgi:hypothetical protein
MRFYQIQGAQFTERVGEVTVGAAETVQRHTTNGV